MNSLQLLPALPYAIAMAAGMVVAYGVDMYPYVWAMLTAVVVMAVAAMMFRSMMWRTAILTAASMTIGMAVMTVDKDSRRVMLPAHEVVMDAVCVEPITVTEKSVSADFIVIGDALDGHKIRCYAAPGSVVFPHLGGGCTLRGILSGYEGMESRGNFSPKRWADSRSLSACMYVSADGISRSDVCVERLSMTKRVAVKAKILRERLLDMLYRDSADDDSRAIVAAMALGDRSSLSKSTHELYAKTGAAHLLALSGMHLGVLFMILTFIFRFVSNRVFGSVCVVVTVWAYVVLVGMPSSVVRAAVMLTIYSIVTLDNRTPMSVNALFVAVALMLLCSPMMIWDVGLQLSFAAMLSIFIFYSPIYYILSPMMLFRHPVLRYVWATVAVSVAAQIGTAPLAVYYFGRLPTVFLITNIVAIPMVTILLYAVFAALLLSVIPVLSNAVMKFVHVVADGLSVFLEYLASWQWASIDGIVINWEQLIIVYAMIATLTVMLKPMFRYRWS